MKRSIEAEICQVINFIEDGKEGKVGDNRICRNKHSESIKTEPQQIGR